MLMLPTQVIDHRLGFRLVARQDRHDRLLIVLFDAQKTVQDRRRRTYVRGLYNSLRRVAHAH